MTLVLGTNIGSMFAIMTSDTARCRAFRMFNHETGEWEKLGEPTPLPGVRDIKSYKLSEKVLVGTAGDSDLSDRIVSELMFYVNVGYDLAECKDALAKLIADTRIRERETSETGTSLLDSQDSVAVFLNGFYHGGETGFVIFTAGKGEEVNEFKNEPGHYQHHMLTPGSGYFEDVGQSLLDLPELYDESRYEGLTAQEEYNLTYETIRKQMWMTHGIASFSNPGEVSTDFVYHILINDGGEIKHITEEAESAPVHDIILAKHAEQKATKE
ncbi:hypothetical protein V6B33_11180 [Mangrovibacillus sp. Mu-81]|uniref:hypothetical protein n=1 Tax=Mangrovibacillus sp. Mu-81 TaxID=3121478 RepID=UPI002FE4AC99